MDTTTILPTPPTSGAIVQSSGSNDFFSTWAGIEATNRNGAMNLKAIGDASIADINATNLASVANLNATNLNGVSVTKNVTDAAVAGINATNLGTVSTTKAVTDSAVANINATSLAGISTTKAVTDSALASALANAEVRELINTTAAANLMATKDSLVALKDDGCKTREQSAAQFAAIQLEACKNADAIEREILKGNAALALQACENKAALAAQIAEICCCVKEDNDKTRALILLDGQKRLETELAEARLKAAIAGLGHCRHDK